MLKVYSETAGLEMEIPTYEHAAAISELANDETIANNVGSVGEFPNPYRLEDANALVESAIANYQLGISYDFLVSLLPKSIPIGLVGARNVNRFSKSAEVGFWTGKQYRLHAYTGKAVSMLLEFCFRELKLNRVYATSIATNVPSIRLMESLGFRREGLLKEAVITKSGPADQLLFGLLSREFESKYPIRVEW